METYESIATKAASEPPPSGAIAKAQELGKTQLEKQKATLARVLESAGLVMRQGSQSLEQQGEQGLSRYAVVGAEQAEKLSRYLRETDASGMVSRVRDTARQQPALVAGSAFIVALLGARLAKSLAPASLPPPEATAEVVPVPTLESAAGVQESNPDLGQPPQ